MRIGVQEEYKDVMLFTARMTLDAIALALDRGMSLDADALRGAWLRVEQGKEGEGEVMAITFPSEVVDLTKSSFRRLGK